MKYRHALAVLFLAFGPAAGALDRIAFADPTVSPGTPGPRAEAARLIEVAADTLGRLYGGSIAVEDEPSRADYVVQIIASLEKDTTALIVSLAGRDGRTSAYLTWIFPLAPDTSLWLARAVHLLWSGLEGKLEQGKTRPPVYVDDLPFQALDPLRMPLSLAVTPSGTLVVALGTGCVELDNLFRKVGEPAKVLAERGNLTFAGGVAATPGGTLVLKSYQGRDLYRVVGEGVEPQRMPAGLELTTIWYWGALADGSAFLVDSSNRKAYRVAPGQRRQELPLFTNAMSFPTAYAAGPESTVWVYDPLLRGVRVHTAEGMPVDIVLPQVDPTLTLSPVAMAVGPDGSFIVLSNQVLYKFRRDGSPVWTLERLSGSTQEALPSSAALAVDWTRGTVWMTDTQSRRITKVLDLELEGAARELDPVDKELIALRARTGQDEADLYEDTARLYDAAGSRLMAKTYWTLLDEVDPGNPAAADELDAIAVEEIAGEAAELDRRARTVLETIGVESARPLSLQAIQKYEQLLARAPGERAARAAMEALKQLFSDTTAPAPRRRPLEIAELRIPDLFPALMQWYAKNDTMSILVRNPLDEAVSDVRVSVRIPRFMDVGVEARHPGTLPSGGTALLPVALALDQRVLDLKEDLVVPVQVTLGYGPGGPERETTRTATVAIHRNSALTWDDTRKISSFVTPNDDVVAGFAARVLASAGVWPEIPLSQRVFRAMRILDAVGTYGIAYVEDPDSPITRTLGRAETVDTVRFPRLTLLNRTGDCDDTTALVCSLLESAGIRTAIATTPGHIFMAFDTGEPAQNAAYLAGTGLEVIALDGSAWIPVETTALSQGFMGAWGAASDLVRKNAASGTLELIRLAQARETYPALPLPPSTLTVADPSRSAVETAYQSSYAAFREEVYRDRVRSLQDALSSESGKAALKLRMQVGVLHALFGGFSEAEAAFRGALAEDPTLVSAYVNLANVRLLERDESGALEVALDGLARNRESPLLNLLAARIYADRGDAGATAEYYAQLKRTAPDLAERYPELAGAAEGGGEARASREGADLPMVWDAGP